MAPPWSTSSRRGGGSRSSESWPVTPITRPRDVERVVWADDCRMRAWFVRHFWFRLLIGGASLVLVMGMTARDEVADASFWDYLREATGRPAAGGDVSTEGRSLGNAMASRGGALAAAEMFAVI